MNRENSKIVRRGKNLSDDAIAQIVRILDEWSGKLTWETLIDAIVKRLYYRYTRQALHKHERIRNAYKLKKEVVSKCNSSKLTNTAEIDQVEARIARLESENQRLETENQRLLEQFVIWAYNAHSRGLTKDFLSQPLPRVSREQTLPSLKLKKTQKKAAITNPDWDSKQV